MDDDKKKQAENQNTIGRSYGTIREMLNPPTPGPAPAPAPSKPAAPVTREKAGAQTKAWLDKKAAASGPKRGPGHMHMGQNRPKANTLRKESDAHDPAPAVPVKRTPKMSNVE